MSKGVRGRGLIDLRKRRAGTQVRAARARALSELPAHRRISLRSRRRKLRALLALAVLVVASGVVYGVSELSYLPRYAIRGVSVEGTGSVPPRLVQAFVEAKLNDGTYSVLSRENIFLYPKADIAQSISGYFPRILSATISRESLLAQAITVTVVERKPFALWCEGIHNTQNTEETGCFVMDERGFIFEAFKQATSSPAGMVVFTGALAGAPVGQTFLPNRFADVLELLSRLRDGGFPVAGVSVESEEDFSVSLSQGFVIRANFKEDANTLVRNLETVLSSDSLRGKDDTIEYVDLRFGNRVYYKTKN